MTSYEGISLQKDLIKMSKSWLTNSLYSHQNVPMLDINLYMFRAQPFALNFIPAYIPTCMHANLNAYYLKFFSIKNLIYHNLEAYNLYHMLEL